MHQLKNVLDSAALGGPVQSDTINDPFSPGDVTFRIAKPSNLRGKMPSFREPQQDWGAWSSVPLKSVPWPAVLEGLCLCMASTWKSSFCRVRPLRVLPFLWRVSRG